MMKENQIKINTTDLKLQFNDEEKALGLSKTEKKLLVNVEKKENKEPKESIPGQRKKIMAEPKTKQMGNSRINSRTVIVDKDSSMNETATKIRTQSDSFQRTEAGSIQKKKNRSNKRTKYSSSSGVCNTPSTENTRKVDMKPNQPTPPIKQHIELNINKCIPKDNVIPYIKK